MTARDSRGRFVSKGGKAGDDGGAGRVAAELAGRLEAIRKAAAAAVYMGGQVIITEAKKRAPLDVGDLRGSGYVSTPRWDSDGVMVECGFGGSASAYALDQHENLTYRHDVGEAKYLERAVTAQAPAVERILAEYPEKALQTGAAPKAVGIHPTVPK